MDLAYYDLKLHRVRFISTIIGVGLLFTIVLAMNGLYRGNIFEGLAIINVTSPDLWVVERHKGGPFNEQSTMPEFFHYSVKSIPGVEKASPFIYYNVERKVGGQSRHFSIIGYDVFGGLGGPKNVYVGRKIEHAHYEAVIHPKLGVGLGEKITLGLHSYTVVGLTREAIDPNGDPLVYLSLSDAQEVLFQKDNEEVRNQRERLLHALSDLKTPAEAEKLLPDLQPDTHIINAILVKVKPGTSRFEVASRIKNWLYFSSFTTQEEIQLMLKGRLQGMTKQLLLFRSLLLFISVVIISLVIYTFTMEKIRTIAVLKLIGAPNMAIIRLVVEQSLLLTITSYLFGLILIQNTYQFFPKTILRVSSDDIVTFAIALLGGILASILGLWQALKTEPAMALGG